MTTNALKPTVTLTNRHLSRNCLKSSTRNFQTTTQLKAHIPRRFLTNEAGAVHKTALLFPGQGSQFVGMGQDFYNEYKVAREVFDEADEALKFKLSELIFNGSQKELTKTYNAQPAILTTSIAILQVLKKEFNFDLTSQVNFVLGHSLGEFTALVATGALNFTDAMKFVRSRGQAMQKCINDVNKETVMSAILLKKDQIRNLEDAMQIIKLSLPNGEIAEIANINSDSQAVISGTREGVNIASRELKDQKIALRAVDLPVSAPFHSSLMRPVRQKVSELLSTVTISSPRIPIIFNASGSTLPVSSSLTDCSELIKAHIIEQVDHTVQWQKSMQFCKDTGVDRFISFGPSKVLGNLARKDHPLDWIQCITSVKELQSEFGTKKNSIALNRETPWESKVSYSADSGLAALLTANL